MSCFLLGVHEDFRHVGRHRQQHERVRFDLDGDGLIGYQHRLCCPLVDAPHMQDLLPPVLQTVVAGLHHTSQFLRQQHCRVFHRKFPSVPHSTRHGHSEREAPHRAYVICDAPSLGEILNLHLSL
eukprot:GHVN01016322.1.p2 GENE.GHVN01016322.1~~GHVN01016322.1.p2  ORF type:complete len:125 (-),score=7.59 GHVN01016322.1:462-836(-)